MFAKYHRYFEAKGCRSVGRSATFKLSHTHVHAQGQPEQRGGPHCEGEDEEDRWSASPMGRVEAQQCRCPGRQAARDRRAEPEKHAEDIEKHVAQRELHDGRICAGPAVASTFCVQQRGTRDAPTIASRRHNSTLFARSLSPQNAPRLRMPLPPSQPSSRLTLPHPPQ